MVIASVALKRDGVVMLAVAIVFSLVAFSMPLGHIVGGLFVAALVAYVYFAFRQEAAAAPANHGAVYDKSLALQEVDGALAPPASSRTSLLVATLTALGGLVLVVIGGRFDDVNITQTMEKVTVTVEGRPWLANTSGGLVATGEVWRAKD